MKAYKHVVSWFILFLFTITGIWMIPALIKKATVEPENYPFVYYSSVAKELCIIDYKDKKAPVKEINGKTYTTEAQADSVFPLFKFRQLLADGKLPDSIDGQELTVQKIRAKHVFYRFSPSDIRTPQTSLYILYESMPKRVGIESPGDVFRLHDGIEFIDIETNSVNTEKSARFQEALRKEGFQFPARWVNGNMNPRKPYDEGYFILDAGGELFHLKMVNGRPFVRNTHAGKQIAVAWFDMLEVADKRFYGFLYDRKGNVYIIGNEEGKYNLLHLGIEPLNLQKDRMMILGNMLYWTVSVTTEKGKDYYGLDMETLQKLSKYHVQKEPDNWDRVASWLFPLYLNFDDKNSDYVTPHLHLTGLKAITTNLFLTLLLVSVLKRPRKRKIQDGVWVLIFGLAGAVATLFVPVDSE